MLKAQKELKRGLGYNELSEDAPESINEFREKNQLGGISKKNLPTHLEYLRHEGYIEEVQEEEGYRRKLNVLTPKGIVEAYCILIKERKDSFTVQRIRQMVADEDFDSPIDITDIMNLNAKKHDPSYKEDDLTPLFFLWRNPREDRFLITLPDTLNAVVQITESYKRDVSFMEIFGKEGSTAPEDQFKQSLIRFIENRDMKLRVLLDQSANALSKRRDVVFTYNDSNKQFFGPEAEQIDDFVNGELAKLQHGGAGRNCDVVLGTVTKTPFALVTFTQNQEQSIIENREFWNTQLTRGLADATALIFELKAETRETIHSIGQAFLGATRPSHVKAEPVGIRGLLFSIRKKT